MKHVNLRLPDDLHKEAAEAAQADQRSLNSEIIWLLRQALQQRRSPLAREEQEK